MDERPTDYIMWYEELDPEDHSETFDIEKEIDYDEEE